MAISIPFSTTSSTSLNLIGGIGIIAVHQDINIRFNFPEHGRDDIALPLLRFPAHDGTRLFK